MQITINQSEIIAAVKAHVENNLIQLRPGATIDVELIAARGGPERFSAIVDIENAAPTKVTGGTSSNVGQTANQAAAASMSKPAPTPTPTKVPVTTMADLKRQQAEEQAAEEAAGASPEVLTEAEANTDGGEQDGPEAEPEADETMAQENAAEDAEAETATTTQAADPTTMALAATQAADAEPKGTEDQPAAKPSLFKGLKKPVNTPAPSAD